MDRKDSKMNEKKTRTIRRALALTVAFSIVISMGMNYSPDRFLKANDAGEAVTEPTVSEQEINITNTEDNSAAEEKSAEKTEEKAVEESDTQNVETASEEIVLEAAGGEVISNEAAEAVAEAEDQTEAEAAEEEKENASIKFFVNGAAVSSVTVERIRGNDPAQYWKEFTAKVVGTDEKHKISWTSADKSIAKPLTDKVDKQYCNDVLIAGYKVGTVTFTASSNVNGETVSASITVSVRESSTWTDGESEMAWEVTPEGELKIGSADGTGTVNFENGSAPWAGSKNSIKKVVVDDGVTTIGENAFAGLSNLEQITLGKNVTTISSGAFTDCKNLRDVTIQNKEALVTIGPGAFRHCDKLTELDLSGCVNLKSIEGDPEDWTKGAFSYGGKNGSAERNLVKVDLTGCANLEEIGDGAFYDRRYLDLDLSQMTSLVRIGKGALEDKHEFNNIDFSGLTNLKEIGEFAFRNNTGVVEINMSGDADYALEAIRADAFANIRGFASNLTKVDLSGCDKLNTIEAGAFQWSGGTGDKTLESVNLSGTALTALEANTFLNQTTLTSVSIPAGMERIDDSAFRGCGGIRNIRWEATDYTRSIANTFKAVAASDRAAMKVTIGKDVNVLPADFFTSLSGAEIVFEANNEGISLKLAGDSEFRTYIVDENGRLYLKADDADHDYSSDEELSAGGSWLALEDRQTLTYNGEEQVLVIPVIPEKGTLSYRFSTDGKNDWKELSKDSVISAVNAGIYEIYFRLSDVTDKTAMIRSEITKKSNPVKVAVSTITMTPNSAAHDFSSDLRLSDGYEGSISDFEITYKVNGSTYSTRGRSGGSITANGVYTPGAAGGTDIISIIVNGKGDDAGNIEQMNYKVAVKVETDVHTITFTDGFGKTVAEITAREGKPVVAPEAPAAGGMLFAGWNQEIPEIMPAEDLMIEAEWEAVKTHVITEDPEAEDDKVIINYVDEDGMKVAETVIAESNSAPIVSPEVEGMTAEFSAIEIDGTSNASVNVVYVKSDSADRIERYVVGAVNENGELTQIESSDIPLSNEADGSAAEAQGQQMAAYIAAAMAAVLAAFIILIIRRRSEEDEK